AEGFLAIKYRLTGSDGKICGGPMYYIELGLKKKFLAKVFASCGMVVALIGIGTMAQTNSIATVCRLFGFPNIATTIITTITVSIITFGGLNKIALVSEKVVPFMAAFYISVAVFILILNFAEIPNIFKLIFCEAFSPKSALLGQVVSIGVSRGIFSHESGLGSSAIAAATAKTIFPVKQGLVSMSGAILSVIICTMTGFVLIIAQNPNGLKGLELTSFAFGSGLGIPSLGKYIVGVGIILFAFTTIIGWNYYGEKCTQYILGDKAISTFKILFLFFLTIGPFYEINKIFILADIVVGCMAIANLIGIIGLRKAVIDETNKFRNC
ncbi:MAG: alanine:cation symporter family protein, partial [Holosporales bacterium]|nr:alanine:cation symporter family protein [Holosporales bacterium]